MLGLFAFFYGVLHLLCYAWLDMGLDLARHPEGHPKRPFILVGMRRLLLLLPLAATSFNRAIKALGAARWQRCTGWCTPSCCWGCCTSSGCAPARTTCRGGGLRA
jgi:DMSO/TMAO reductase YedYZ heme-binding membrane subunit